MVFWDTCLQIPCRPGTSLNTSRNLFDGSVPENHEDFYLSLRSRANARSRPPDYFYSVRKDRRAATNQTRAHRPRRRTHLLSVGCHLCGVCATRQPLWGQATPCRGVNYVLLRSRGNHAPGSPTFLDLFAENAENVSFRSDWDPFSDKLCARAIKMSQKKCPFSS